MKIRSSSVRPPKWVFSGGGGGGGGGVAEEAAGSALNFREMSTGEQR